MSPVRNLKPKPISGFLLNLFGRNGRGVQYDGNVLTISARLPSKISLAELSSAPTVTSGFWGATLSFKADERDEVHLKGTKPNKAEQFSSVIQKDWQQFHQSQWQKRHDEIEAIIQKIAALNHASSYPAACLVEPLLTQARKLDTTLLSKLPKDAMVQKHLRIIDLVQGFVKAAKQVRGKAIETFQQNELTAWEHRT